MTSHNNHGLPARGRTASSSGSHSFLRKLTSFTKRSKSQSLVASPSYTTATTYAPLPTPPSSPPSTSSSAPHRMALAAAKTASLQATVNAGLLTPPSTARPLSRPKTAAPGTASSTLSSSRPTTCNAPLTVQVEIRFPGLDGLGSTPSYTHEYCSSQNLHVSNRLCKGLLRRLTHCSTELITRRDSRALMQQQRHGHSVSTKPLSYELHFRIVCKDSGLWADKTFCSYQTQDMSRQDAHEVILATHRMIGLFLRRHDPAFRWSDAPAAQLASFVPRPEEPELVPHTVDHPLPLSCIPRSRFLDDTQSFEFVPGYAIKLLFRSRCHARKQYEWKRAISLRSNQSAPLSLALAEDLLWQTFESVNTILSVRREAFNDEHKACDFLEGVVSCQHFDEDALDIELKIQNNVGPDYTHLTRSIQSKLALFRHVDGLDCANFIQHVHSHFVQSRETADNRVSSLPDFDYRITALKTPTWSLDNPARFVLDASTSYSRRSIEAILNRVETGITDVLHHKGCTVHVVAYKRGHLILDKFISTPSYHTRPALFPKARAEEDVDEIVANLKERIHQDINAVCKDTCSLDSLDNIDDLRESATEARSASNATYRHPSSSASPPMTPASATSVQFEETVVLEQSSVIDDEPIVPAPRVVELPDNFYVDDSRPSSPATSASTRRRAFPLVPEKFILPPSPQRSPPGTAAIPDFSQEVTDVIPAELPVKVPEDAFSEASIESPVEAPTEDPILEPVETPVKALIEAPEAPTQNQVETSLPDTIADSVGTPPGQTLLELAEMLAHTLDEIVREMETPDEPEPFVDVIETPDQAAFDALIENSEAMDKDSINVLAEPIPETAKIPDISTVEQYDEPLAERLVEVANNDKGHLQPEIEGLADTTTSLCEATPRTLEPTTEDTAVEIPDKISEPMGDVLDDTQNTLADVELLVHEAPSYELVEQFKKDSKNSPCDRIASIIPQVSLEATTPEVCFDVPHVGNTAMSGTQRSPEADLDDNLAVDLVVEAALSPVLASPTVEEESSVSCYESFPEDNMREDTASENDSSLETTSQSADSYLPQALFTFDNGSESDAEEQTQEEVCPAPFDDVSFLYNFEDFEEDLSPIELNFERAESSFPGAQLDTILELDDEISSDFYLDFPAYDQALPDIPSVDNVPALATQQAGLQTTPQQAFENESLIRTEQAPGLEEALYNAELLPQPVREQVEIMIQQDEDFDASEYSDDEPLMFSSPTRMSRSNPITSTASIPAAEFSDHTHPSTPTLSHSSGGFDSPEASFLETPKIGHDAHQAKITCFDSDNDARYGHAYDADGESEPEPHFAVFAREPKPAADISVAPVVLGESLLEQPFRAPVSPTVCEISESDSTHTEVWRETEQVTTDTELANTPPRSTLDLSSSAPAFSFEADPMFEDFAATKPDIDLEEFVDIATVESDLEYYNGDVLHDTVDVADADEFQLPDYDGTAQTQQYCQLEVECNPESIRLSFSDNSDLLEVERSLQIHDEETSRSVAETKLHIDAEPAGNPVPLPLDEPASPPDVPIQSGVVDTPHSNDLADAFTQGDVDELALSESGAPSDDSSANLGNFVEPEVTTHQRVELIDLDSESLLEAENCSEHSAQVLPIELNQQPADVPVLEALFSAAAIPVIRASSVLPTTPEFTGNNTVSAFATPSESTTTRVSKMVDIVAPLEDTADALTQAAHLLSIEDREGLDSPDIAFASVVETVEKLPPASKSVIPLQPTATGICQANILASVAVAQHPVSWFLPKSGLVGLDESRLVRVGLRGALTGSRAFDNISCVASGLHLHDSKSTVDDDIDLFSADEDKEEPAPAENDEPSTPAQAKDALPENKPTPTPSLPLTVAAVPQTATITKAKEEPKSNQDVILPRVIMAFASMAVMSQMINRSSSN